MYEIIKSYLYHDYLIQCDQCNLACKYCVSTEAGTVFGQYTPQEKGERLIDVRNAYQVIKTFYDKVPAPLLKISGGEIFLFKNIAELIEQLAELYPHVQIITNGTLLTEEIVDRLAPIKNIGFHFSLDGHTWAMNSHRFPSERLHQKVMKSFEYTLQKMGSAEITSVITDINYQEYPGFLSYLQQLPGQVKAFPIPVRGNQVNQLFSLANRHAFAGILRGIKEQYPAVTGPGLYYQKLADFLGNEKLSRTDRCLIPLFAVQIFDTGVVTPCPLGWTLSFGNVLADDNGALYDNIDNHKLYDLLTHTKPKMAICKDCFSQTDIINLYLRGEIVLAEIAEVPMYHTPAVQERLKTLKEKLTETGFTG